jgi:hypothetical protein
MTEPLGRRMTKTVARHVPVLAPAPAWASALELA